MQMGGGFLDSQLSFVPCMKQISQCQLMAMYMPLFFHVYFMCIKKRIRDYIIESH